MPVLSVPGIPHCVKTGIYAMLRKIWCKSSGKETSQSHRRMCCKNASKLLLASLVGICGWFVSVGRLQMPKGCSCLLKFCTPAIDWQSLNLHLLVCNGAKNPEPIRNSQVLGKNTCEIPTTSRYLGQCSTHFTEHIELVYSNIRGNCWLSKQLTCHVCHVRVPIIQWHDFTLQFTWGFPPWKIHVGGGLHALETFLDKFLSCMQSGRNDVYSIYIYSIYILHDIYIYVCVCVTFALQFDILYIVNMYYIMYYVDTLDIHQSSLSHIFTRKQFETKVHQGRMSWTRSLDSLMFPLSSTLNLVTKYLNLMLYDVNMIFIMLYHTGCIYAHLVLKYDIPWSVWTLGFEKKTIFDASNPVCWSLILTSASLIQDLNSPSRFGFFVRRKQPLTFGYLFGDDFPRSCFIQRNDHVSKCSTKS